MIELALLAALLLFMGIGGRKINRDVERRHTREARRKAQALEPRFKSREDYWAA